MAAVDGFSYTSTTTTALNPSTSRRQGYAASAASGVRFNYARRSDGLRGSTTDITAIPAGAAVEAIVTS